MKSGNYWNGYKRLKLEPILVMTLFYFAPKVMKIIPAYFYQTSRLRGSNLLDATGSLTRFAPYLHQSKRNKNGTNA